MILYLSSFTFSYLSCLFGCYVHPLNIYFIDWIFFNSKVSTWFTFIVSISLLIFSFIGNMFYFTSLIIVTINFKNFVASSANIWLISRPESINFLYTWNCILFSWLFLCQIILNFNLDTINVKLQRLGILFYSIEYVCFVLQDIFFIWVWMIMFCLICRSSRFCSDHFFLFNWVSLRPFCTCIFWGQSEIWIDSFRVSLL